MCLIYISHIIYRSIVVIIVLLAMHKITDRLFVPFG